MDKRMFFPGNAEAERTAFFVREDRNYLVKRASQYHPEVMRYIQEAKPLPSLVQVLLTAMGATEFWPQNANGDRFREAMLKPVSPEFGHKTFETFANYFTHHVNKDPLLSKGKVLRAIWNDGAKRVELIVGIDINKDPEAATAIDRGEDLAFSMGCKVPYDVCTICMNRARNRGEYCDHARYMMNQIDPVTGLLVGVDNINPKFFDISRVLIPADKTAFLWTKIASAANPFHGVPSAVLAEAEASGKGLLKAAAEYREANPPRGTALIIDFSKKSDDKAAAVTKKSDMIKRVPANIKPQLVEKLDHVVPRVVDKLEANSPSIDKRTADLLANIALPELISTFMSLGMIPKPSELAPAVARQGAMPAGQAFGPELFNGEAAHHLMPLLEQRSYFRPQLTKRLVLLVKRARAGEAVKIGSAEPLASTVEKTLRINREGKQTADPLSPTTIAALLAATYVLFGPHTTGAARGIGKIISNHPFLALSLGAGTIKALQSLQGQSVIGSYDLDDQTRSFYNTNWQSRFARAQARPVTVIKTGTAQHDTQFAKKLLFGVPAIYLGSAAARAYREATPEKQHGVASRVMSDHPDLLSMGLIGEHIAGRPVSKHIERAIESGKRLFKHASLDDLEFISSLPSPEWELVSDTAILAASLELANI